VTVPATDQASASVHARLVITDSERSTPLAISAPGAATLSEVAAASPDLSALAGGMWIGSHHFPATTAMADLPIYDGLEVTTRPGPASPDPVRELQGLSGARAGTILSVAAGHPHATRPVGSVIAFADTVWLVSAPAALEPSLAVVVHRPPRRLPEPSAPFPTPPPIPEDPVRSPALRWTMIVGPLVMGAVLVVLFRRWHFALFMLLSPFMAFLNHVDGKWRARSGSKANSRRRTSDLGAYAGAVGDWLRTEHQSATTSHPSMVEVAKRARTADGTLWQRRPHHADFLDVYVGYGPPPIPAMAPDADCNRVILTRTASTAAFPAVLGLRGGTVIGIVGPRPQRRAMARSLILQLAVHHGPADLALGALTHSDEPSVWRWMAWLPHATDDDSPLLCHTPSESERVFARASEQGRRGVFVVDQPFSPLHTPVLQSAITRGIDLVVLAEDAGKLPAMTTYIVETSDVGYEMRHGSGGSLGGGTGVFVSLDIADQSARALARLSDPELVTAARSLPRSLRLVELIGDTTPDGIRRRWTAGGPVSAPIGVGPEGRLDIDLVADGPHGLLAGTTGAGKSEFLRTLVASLALHVDPARLNFVLIDYKGGSAFDVCADLPHVAGIVTDLDDHLASRALTCLEAELRYREHVLRDAGASDIGELDDPTLLARLLIVIDEFAALANELPDFMASLVDMAARGRSLGVHLLLATQRPAGVVKDTIRANTNLRISLRVQDVADARDVVDDPAPAHLPRSTPGRGMARFGPSELVEFQSAYVSGSGSSAAAITARPFDAGPAPRRPAEDGATDLAGIVRAVVEAADSAGFPPPRTPWPEPLPSSVDLRDILTHEPGIPYALADDPVHQRQVPMAWIPEDGHSVFFGLPGTGPEAAVETVLRAACSRYRPDEASVFPLSHGTTSVPPADHIADPVVADDSERRHRLFRHLARELERRRQTSTSHKVFLVVDDIADVQRVLEPYHLADDADTFAEVLTKGHLYGIHVVATASTATAIRSKLVGSFTHRVAFAFADDTSLAALGISPRLAPPATFGRGVHVGSGLVLQVADNHRSVTPRTGASDRPTIPVLPGRLDFDGLIADITDDHWWIPLGLGEEDLAVAGVEVGPHDHVFVSGPARTGKSTTLLTMARAISAADPDGYRVAIVPRRSPLEQHGGLFSHVVHDPDEVGDLVRGLAKATADVVVFVDDAEMIDGFDDLIRSRRAPVRVVAAVRMEDAASLYGHWTRRVRQSRIGILLDPLEGAGDLLGVRLPRPTGTAPAGRGFIVQNGSVEKVQVAV